jgi:DNA-binding helix-hairpin-helix protein with protein kinase domain
MHMAAARVFDATGTPVFLGKEIGRGGEGAVYEIGNRPDAVAKLYLKPPSPSHQAKLLAMTSMATPNLLRLAAWPTGTLHNQSGSVVGFAMPKVTGHNPIFKLYGPKLRLHEFPKADWRFLIHAAANSARAFSTVHTAGLVIGDVNHGNLVVAQDATVRLIDCDSFQVTAGKRIWFCEVGVGTHQPPEMQSLTTYAGVARTPNHDNFGLAVIIFQLLCMARHPFMGRYLGTGEPPSIEEAIAKSRYAYSHDSKRTMLAPPPGSLPIDALPSDLRDLFEAAFAPGSARGGRPTPERWIVALQQLGANLRECTLNQTHRYTSTLAHCPWCEIEVASGTPLFPVVFITKPGAATGIAALWQEVTQLSAPQPLPSLPDPEAIRVPPSATALAAGQRGRRLQAGSYAAVAASSMLALAAAPPNLRVLLVVAIAAIVAALYGMQAKGSTPERRRFEGMKSDWMALRTDWNAPSIVSNFVDTRRQLDITKAKYDSLLEQRTRRMQLLAEQVRQRQLEQYLDGFPIGSARISGIGRAKAATLSSHGIDTASDITQARVIQVPGFGEVMTRRLTDWRRALEQNFRFDPRRGVPQSDIAIVERDIVLARATLEREIFVGLGRLKAIVASASARQTTLTARAANLAQLYTQAKADARATAGDPTTHKRLLCLAGVTTFLAVVMFAYSSALQAGSPVATAVPVLPPALPSTIEPRPAPPVSDQPDQVTTIALPVPPPIAAEVLQNPVLAPPVLPPAPPSTIALRTPPPVSDQPEQVTTIAPPVPPPTIGEVIQKPAVAPPVLSAIGKVITRQAANVRDAPNGTTVVRTAPQGAVLRVYARRDGWVQVGGDAPWGWIYSGLLSEAP